MTTFIHEPDADGEPTLWVLENGDTDDYRYTGLLSRCNLAPDVRRFWPDVVARMTGTTITNNDATIETISRAIADHNHGFAGSWPHHTDEAKAILAALTGVPHD